MRPLKTRLIGWIALAIGIWILWKISHQFIGPWVFFVIGIILLRKHHRKWGYFFLLLFAITLISQIIGIEWEWIVLALLLLFFGYRWAAGDELKERPPGAPEADQRKEMFSSGNLRLKSPKYHSSLMGSLYLMNPCDELTDINVSSGISDIKLDLSKTIIPEGETTIVISGLIGDVDIYVPDDLDLSVAATVSIGYLDIFGYKQGGLNRQGLVETEDYHQARRKVKISISLLAGDVGVRYL